MTDTHDLAPAQPAPEPELKRILTVMRQRIANRRIAPGTKLQEHALADEFGVSRVRIREVLLALEQRGLVERQPNRSAIVATLNAKRVYELFDVRESLEGLCTRLAVEKSAPESWQDLVELFDGPMERYARDGDLESYLAEIDRFRNRLIEAADNLILAEALESLYDKTRAIVERTVMLPGRVAQGLKELQLVIAAMRRGDAAEAARLRCENIRSQREYLRRYQNFVL
jgi:DNA-binding GntR family transcriptional regulator